MQDMAKYGRTGTFDPSGAQPVDPLMAYNDSHAPGFALVSPPTRAQRETGIREFNTHSAWHGGASCPVPAGTRTRVWFRSIAAATVFGHPEILDWRHTGASDDIIAYAVG